MLSEHTIPFREMITYIRFDSELMQKVFTQALEALLDDLDVAGYDARISTKEKIDLLRTAIADRKFSDDPEDDQFDDLMIDEDDLDLDIEDEDEDEDESDNLPLDEEDDDDEIDSEDDDDA